MPLEVLIFLVIVGQLGRLNAEADVEAMEDKDGRRLRVAVLKALPAPTARVRDCAGV